MTMGIECKIFVTLIIQSIIWYTINGDCDTSVCPIICAGVTCPLVGSGSTTAINVTGPVAGSPSCLEVIIESIGYPNYYPADQCEWTFVPNKMASSVIQVLEFEGGTGDILHIERTKGTRTAIRFHGDSDALTTTEFHERADEVKIQFMPTQIEINKGLQIQVMFSEEESNVPCTDTETFVLSSDYPVGAISSPHSPSKYNSGAECYYHITSPASTEIILEFMGILRVTPSEDYVFIYDYSNASNPALLRVVSHLSIDPWRHVKTGTNAIQIAFKDYGATVDKGFFARLSFEDVTPACYGQGNKITACECYDVYGGPLCQVNTFTDFVQLTPPIFDADLEYHCGLPTEIRYEYNSSNANSYFASGYYFDPSATDTVRCSWDFIGEHERSKYAVIIREFQLGAGDKFEFLYTDGRESRIGLRYSSAVVDLPVTRDLVTFSWLDNPIIIDSYSMQITYRGTASDPATYPGVLFEVHLVDGGEPAARCSSPCLNGGLCAATCNCDPGYQGQFCEQ